MLILIKGHVALSILGVNGHSSYLDQTTALGSAGVSVADAKSIR